MPAEQVRGTAPWHLPTVYEEGLGAFLGELALPHAAEAVGAARRFTHCVTLLWGAPEVGELAKLCVSEAVTNVYQHTKPEKGSQTRLILFRLGTRLRCEVHDPSRSVPKLTGASLLDESGRGMLLIDTIAQQHGVYQTGNGKAVWFELEAWPADEQDHA
ncbi:ATP-binding protein [Spirillospora sp. NPDC127200]